MRKSTSACAALCALALVATTATGCSNSLGSGSIEVQTLWYSKADDGAISGGVTPVQILASTRAEPTSFTVDLQGLKDAGAGSQWTAATASAAVVAVLASAKNPSLTNLQYELNEAIDGPSAGGLLAAGSRAAISAQQVSKTIAMTGTILPDGSLGRVGGIPAKVRGAASYGIKQILIPASQATATDPVDNKSVQVATVGESVGVQITTVKSIWDALPTLTGVAATAATGSTPAMSSQLASLLTSRAQALASQTATQLKNLAKINSSSLAGVSAANAQAAAQKILAVANGYLATDPALAYAAAGQAAKSVAAWSASAKLAAGAARGVTVTQATADLTTQAGQLLTTTQQAVTTSAATPTSSAEQLVALTDALAWGIDAYGDVLAAQSELSANPEYTSLDAIAADLSNAQFDVENYLATSVAAVGVLTGKALADPAASTTLLSNYADFFAYAGDANLTYAGDVVKNADATNHANELAKQAKTVQQHESTLTAELGSDSAKAVVSASMAISYFMASSLLVANLTASQSGTQSVAISDPDGLKYHISLSNEIAIDQLKQLAAAGMDASYGVWNAAWGKELAERGQAAGDGLAALNGLDYQWFTNIDNQLLVALQSGGK